MSGKHSFLNRSARKSWYLLLGIALIWASFVTYQLIRASRELHSGVDLLKEGRERFSLEDLQSGRVVATLSDARDKFGAASERLDSAFMAPLRFVPIAGRQLRSVSALSRGADEVSSLAMETVGQSRRAISDRPSAGFERVALLKNLAVATASAHEGLDRVDLGPAEGLISPLAEKRQEFDSELLAAKDALSRISSGLGGLANLLEGPGRYLLLAANNAEMRAGSGMFLSAGVLETGGGNVVMGELMQTSELQLPPEGVPLEGDLANLWGWLGPNHEWRNLGVSPAFDVTGALASRMWEWLEGRPVDGVVAIDVMGVQSILEASGMTHVEGAELPPNEIGRFLLHDQYVGLTHDDDRSDQHAGRRDRLGILATAAFKELNRGDGDLVSLATGLAEAVNGRHLMVWSSDPQDQASWIAAEAAGALTERDLLVAVLNRGGNKLDYFLMPQVDLQIRPEREHSIVTVRTTLQNVTPLGESSYIAGPNPDDPESREGVYVGLLSITMPKDAKEVVLPGVETLAASGRDGPTNVVAVHFDLERGASKQFVVQFRLPGRHGSLRILPSARAPAVPWKAGRAQFTDSVFRFVHW